MLFPASTWSRFWLSFLAFGCAFWFCTSSFLQMFQNRLIYRCTGHCSLHRIGEGSSEPPVGPKDGFHRRGIHFWCSLWCSSFISSFRMPGNSLFGMVVPALALPAFHTSRGWIATISSLERIRLCLSVASDVLYLAEDKWPWCCSSCTVQLLLRSDGYGVLAHPVLGPKLPAFDLKVYGIIVHLFFYFKEKGNHSELWCILSVP